MLFHGCPSFSSEKTEEGGGGLPALWLIPVHLLVIWWTSPFIQLPVSVPPPYLTDVFYVTPKDVTTPAFSTYPA